MSSFVESKLKSNYSDGFFNIGPINGFLPLEEPLHQLPNKYNLLNNLCLHLHVNQEDSILAIPNRIVAEVDKLPNYLNEVKNETNKRIIQALFRAYSFVTSAYTLESSYQEWKKSGNYGTARRVLPRQVSEPFVEVAKKLDVFPWIDYHYSYSLGNYIKKDPNGGFDWRNLDMALKFAGTSDEVGFIMVHVYINEVGPNLLKSIYKVNNGILNNDNNIILEGLKINLNTIKDMNRRRQEMWKASNPKKYNEFRIFVMGIKGNEELFGEGLVYENCFNNEPQKYRGSTGAQDDIIPTEDIFTGLTDYYPQNKLTEYLIDLQKYRPKCVQEFFDDLRATFGNKALLDHLRRTGHVDGLIVLWRIVDEVYRFRNGHWQFVQQYIMANTRYEKATGGTPVTSWLINQIEACLQFQAQISECIQSVIKSNESTTTLSEDEELITAYTNLSSTLLGKQQLLHKQVEHLNKETKYDIQLLYDWNVKYHLCDDPAIES